MILLEECEWVEEWAEEWLTRNRQWFIWLQTFHPSLDLLVSKILIVRYFSWIHFDLAYNELIPNANEGSYQNLKQNYMADLAKEAPSFLAYIEIYDDDFRYLNPDKSFTTGICTGSLISTQYVLT